MGAIEDAIIAEAEVISELVEEGRDVEAAMLADSMDDAIFGTDLDDN